MSDASLLERLRGWRWSSNLDSTICEEAAEEIERATANETALFAANAAQAKEIERLSAALTSIRDAIRSPADDPMTFGIADKALRT